MDTVEIHGLGTKSGFIFKRAGSGIPFLKNEKQFFFDYGEIKDNSVLLFVKSGLRFRIPLDEVEFFYENEK